MSKESDEFAIYNEFIDHLHKSTNMCDAINRFVDDDVDADKILEHHDSYSAYCDEYVRQFEVMQSEYNHVMRELLEFSHTHHKILYSVVGGFKDINKENPVSEESSDNTESASE